MFWDCLYSVNMGKARHRTRHISVKVTDFHITGHRVKITHINGEPLDRPISSLFEIRRVHQKALQTAESEPLLSQAEKPSLKIGTDRVAKVLPGTGLYVQTQKTLYIWMLRI
ncbi:hypothetical protein CEP52_014778 [Fusarium oligoseptatum]|uniref:Uncharacterized protein n=1 Tax=Fusarium oligoseptatum TaxID=2604345 RepID=A0A428SJC8_9HYPO|nr:hypothetical protein CEP52_014778 [Fusarium oligoseptatum]